MFTLRKPEASCVCCITSVSTLCEKTTSPFTLKQQSQKAACTVDTLSAAYVHAAVCVLTAQVLLCIWKSTKYCVRVCQQGQNISPSQLQMRCPPSANRVNLACAHVLQHCHRHTHGRAVRMSIEQAALLKGSFAEVKAVRPFGEIEKKRKQKRTAFRSLLSPRGPLDGFVRHFL